MRITVIGTGYLGAVHAACMADIGHEVLGVDVDEAKIAALAEGRPPFFEPGLPDLLSRTHERGNLRFTTSLAEAAEFGDVHFVCVGTPQRKGTYAADIRHVAVTKTPRLLDARNALDREKWQAAGWTYRALGRPAA